MDEGEERIREAYGAEKYDRLKALKRRYDPDNFFRLNQNIPAELTPRGHRRPRLIWAHRECGREESNLHVPKDTGT